ncbi:unnamed protein product [Lactuca saligna]|uniref:Uncharacterized protein n=1 Tax=Lactuca saligna TaxID=75948 RepID=A0AA36EMX3_LACSI|nr:unnamed protein product [Lactuca saligna]
MGTENSTIPSEAEFKLLSDAYSLSPPDGVEFQLPDLMILSPPPGKVGVYLKTLDNGLCLPLTNFQDKLLHKNGCSIQMFTPNVVNKVVAFKMICRANRMLPNYFVFKYFFRFYATRDKYTFYVRQGGTPWFLMVRPPIINSKTSGCGSTKIRSAVGGIGQTTLLRVGGDGEGDDGDDNNGGGVNGANGGAGGGVVVRSDGVGGSPAIMPVGASGTDVTRIMWLFLAS